MLTESSDSAQEKGDRSVEDYHCCATCIHFRAERVKQPPVVHTYCSRLRYDTKPKYKFDCWDPIDRVRKLLHGEVAGGAGW